MFKKCLPFSFVAILCAGAALIGCHGRGDVAPARRAVDVGVVTVKPQSVAITTDLPGRTSSYRVAEVRPQVSGVVLKRLFVEGAEVKAGQPLYQIDPAPFRASYDSAKATLAHAQAELTTAKLQEERYRPLVEANAVSRQTYDNAVASALQAQADVASGKASVETARINLAYTNVLAPISGRTSRSSVTEGALVTANQTTVLVTVTLLDPIYVDVTQPATVWLRLQRELDAGQLVNRGTNAAAVGLTLEDGSEYAREGSLQFSEVTVDQSTGSVTLRAEFPNPRHLLLPGMFVRARIQEGVRQQALLVPERGVTHDQRGDPVALIVGVGNKVEQRTLQTDRVVGSQWLVVGGIKAGDRVVVSGVQIAHPGDEVTPVEAGQPAAVHIPAPNEPNG
ncbi:MAG: efflux transporter, family, subunit [Gammaproteobacteria bacterium]|nr:efflux transporter, family, subunit [Gammaproteobacteria bacterium]